MVAPGAAPNVQQASCMPTLPASASGAATTAAAAAAASDQHGLDQDKFNAVLDLVIFLQMHVDPSLDVASCAEALDELCHDPPAATKFMRVGYAALSSAARVNNGAGAVAVVKRYLQKQSAPVIS